MGCIYLVRCRVNGKRYVGKTVHRMEGRKRAHENSAKKGSKQLFHRALRKYGFEAFEWSVIFDDVDDDELNEFEKIVIRNMKTKRPNGYNLTDGGDGMIGMRRSFAAIERTRQKHLGMKRTLQTRENMRKAQLKLTEDGYIRKGKKGIPAWNLGKKTGPLPPDKGNRIPWNKGKKGCFNHSVETRQKLSIIARDRAVSDETRKKMSMAKKGRKGNPHTIQTKMKLSEAKKGKPLSMEHRQKLREAQKNRRLKERENFGS